MKPNVEMDPNLIKRLEKIAERFGSSSDEIFNEMAEWYLKKQEKYFEELDKMSADELWYDLLGPTYKAQIKEAEKENRRKGIIDGELQKIIVFPTKNTPQT